MSFLEVFVSPAYRVSKEHLFICNGVATLEDFFLSRLSTVSLSDIVIMGARCRTAACSEMQCAVSSIRSADPPAWTLWFTGSTAHRLGLPSALLAQQTRSFRISFFFFLSVWGCFQSGSAPVRQRAKSRILTFNWTQLTFTQHQRTSCQD